MNVWVKIKAAIHRKDQTLCSWSCPHIEQNIDCGSIRCAAYREDLDWVTLRGGREMAKRCRRCRANTLRAA
jgi:DNA-binding transcriptional regulator YdaS (Cro superfamily)